MSRLGCDPFTFSQIAKKIEKKPKIGRTKNGEHNMIGLNLWDLLVCDLHTATSILV
jgi:hypothetical protein